MMFTSSFRPKKYHFRKVNFLAPSREFLKSLFQDYFLLSSGQIFYEECYYDVKIKFQALKNIISVKFISEELGFF